MGLFRNFFFNGLDFESPERPGFISDLKIHKQTNNSLLLLFLLKASRNGGSYTDSK